MLDDDLKRKLNVLWRERDWAKCLAAIHEFASPWHFITQTKREGFMLGAGFGLGCLFELETPENFFAFMKTLVAEYRTNGSIITIGAVGSQAQN